MKILHIISQRPDSTGSGIYLRHMLAEAAAAGHHNFLLCAIRDGDLPDPAGVARFNTRYIRFNTADNPGNMVGMSDVMPYPSRTFRSLDEPGIKHYLNDFRQVIAAAVADFQPDLIHCHHLWLVTSLTAQMFPELPVTASCHGSELRQFAQCPHLQDRVLSGCRMLAGVCALTHSQKQTIVDTYSIDPDIISVVGAGFNEDLFHAADNLSGRSSDICRLVYAGKLSRAKGVPWLLEALQVLSDYPFHLHLIGSGSGVEYDHCIELANRLEHRVTRHGGVSQQRLGELMRESDVFVLPSLHEGLPLVVLEALASGCQVIAVDLPGTREIADRLNSERLILIPAPAVIDTDATILDNADHFVNSLKVALVPWFSSHRPTQGPIPDLSSLNWKSVFLRIQMVWSNTMIKKN